MNRYYTYTDFNKSVYYVKCTDKKTVEINLDYDINIFTVNVFDFDNSEDNENYKPSTEELFNCAVKAFNTLLQTL